MYCNPTQDCNPIFSLSLDNLNINAIVKAIIYHVVEGCAGTSLVLYQWRFLFLVCFVLFNWVIGQNVLMETALQLDK